MPRIPGRRYPVSEPEEIVIASVEATYTYAGRLEDGTRVVRDSNGVLHALIPLTLRTFEP